MHTSWLARLRLFATLLLLALASPVFGQAPPGTAIVFSSTQGSAEIVWNFGLIGGGPISWIQIQHCSAGVAACTDPSADPVCALLQTYIVGVRTHTFRHSCATHMLRAGAPIRHLQEMLRHASIETTQVYTRVTITDLKAVHRRFHPREQNRGDETRGSDQSNPSYMENVTPEEKTELRGRERE